MSSEIISGNVNDPEFEYISGEAYHKISQWSFCPRHTTTMEPLSFKENDMVFLNLDSFDHFINTLNLTPPKEKFILITHNSDGSFNNLHYDRVKGFVNKIYAINNTCMNPMVVSIPIGFRSWPNNTIPLIKSIDVNLKDQQKDILIYMNFTIGTNHSKRGECYDRFSQKEWVKQENNIPINDFYKDLKRSKYVLSPEGTGIDCHRIYESIFFDSIPILKTSLMDNFYKGLPVLIVEDWGEITEVILNLKYDLLKSRLINWKNDNKEWLKPAFWFNRS